MIDDLAKNDICIALNNARDNCTADRWHVLLLVASMLTQQLGVIFIYHPFKGFTVES